MSMTDTPSSKDRLAVLFVDDEPNILAGLKRSMRSIRDRFDLNYAESGEVALKLCKEKNIDIVVSDMRMPGMDGTELFIQLRECSPQTIRIMLSGQVDENEIIKSAAIAHRFLSKPCEPDILKEVLNRSAIHRELVRNKHITAITTGIDSLPALPELYIKLQELLNEPEVDLKDVSIIIEQDLGMASKLLQLVNSSFFGLLIRVDTIEKAVKLLGVETVRSLVLGIKIFQEAKIANSTISTEYLWRHSLAVARCSEEIAKDFTGDKRFINSCFIAGLLHDIGRLVLLCNMEEIYKSIVEKSQDEDVTLTSVEYEILSTSHAEVGAYLLGLWGFNCDIVEAVAFHHRIADYPATKFTAALAVHIAETHYHKLFLSDSIGHPTKLNVETIEVLGLRERIDSWNYLAENVYKLDS